MWKFIIGLFGIFAVVGTADVDNTKSLLLILLLLIAPCAIFLKGAHELLELTTVTYDDNY